MTYYSEVSSKQDNPVIRHRRSGDLVVLQRHPPIQHNPQNNFGVDRFQQYRSKNPVGIPYTQFWKYFMNIKIEVCILNSFLSWLKTPGTAEPSKNYSLNAIAHQVVKGYEKLSHMVS